MNKINLIIADDHILFAEGIRNLLDNSSEINVIDIVNDGKELLDVLNIEKPEIILLDVNMPKINGLEALKKINLQHRDTKVIMLSTYNDLHLIQKAKEYGAKGYLIKDISKENLIKCIKKVMDNGTCFPEQKRTDLNDFDKNNDIIKRYQLTKRELEIVNLIGKGLTNNQIAETLFLSVYTIETHRKNIMQKLELNNPGSLIKFILENDL